MSMVACGEKEDKKSVNVTSVSLNKAALTLNVDASETLTAKIYPSDATNKGVKWTSSDASVATVDNDGKVTALKLGIANITVTTDDAGLVAFCDLIVTINGITITVGTQESPMRAGIPGMVSFRVNTTYINIRDAVSSASFFSSATFFSNVNGINPINVPGDLQITRGGIGDTYFSMSFVSLQGAPPSGKYYFRLKIDGVFSNVAILTIDP